MANLSGKTALVTGASRGIGAATARALARDGARVIAHYGNSAKEADAVVAEIRKSGGKADALGANLEKADGAHNLAKQVRQMVGQRLDILVANAGVAKPASIEATTIEDFDRHMAINVRAPFFLVQQLLPVLGEGSNVVFLSSVIARSVLADYSAYAVTKGAIDTLVKQFAAALGPKNIRVNAVAPGIIETDMASFTRTSEGRALTLSIQAFKRVGQPSDIADVITFLASDAARWITGETIEVSGGSKL